MDSFVGRSGLRIKSQTLLMVTRRLSNAELSFALAPSSFCFLQSDGEKVLLHRLDDEPQRPGVPVHLPTLSLKVKNHSSAKRNEIQTNKQIGFAYMTVACILTRTEG